MTRGHLCSNLGTEFVPDLLADVRIHPHLVVPLTLTVHTCDLCAFCSAKDGRVQNAAADADSVLELLKLRLRKLRASGGEDVLTADCMYELARRLKGRARYEEAEELYRECLCISLDLSFPQEAMVIALVFASCFLYVPHKGNWCYYFWDMFATKERFISLI